MCVCLHRKLERVHAAVMGAHKRHGCLLPLEMYLEEDIPLVCYIRDKPYAEMVELPEQSCHCFLSFSNASADPPALKVGLLGLLHKGEKQSLRLLTLVEEQPKDESWTPSPKHGFSCMYSFISEHMGGGSVPA